MSFLHAKSGPPDVLEKERIVEALHMQPHPEGGYYVETFRSSTNVETDRGSRAASTAILFLLGKGDKSHLHRIKSEEVWHFHSGGPLAIIELKEDIKSFSLTVLGPNILRGEKLQHVVPANTWFGSYPYDEESPFSLVGCTVAPGFIFEDFELAQNREELTQLFPNAVDPINHLTPHTSDIRQSK
jgi:hypothetical protein